MRRLALAAAALLTFAGLQAPATAQTTVGGCFVTTNLAAGINFGVYDPLSANPISTVWTVNWTCPFGTAGYSVSFSGGNSANAKKRFMSDALGEKLTYNIYLDAAHTQVIGDGTAGTFTLTGGPSTATNYSVNFFALLDGGQKNVSAFQTFTDDITATINF